MIEYGSPEMYIPFNAKQTHPRNKEQVLLFTGTRGEAIIETSYIDDSTYDILDVFAKSKGIDLYYDNRSPKFSVATWFTPWKPYPKNKWGTLRKDLIKALSSKGQ